MAPLVSVALLFATMVAPDVDPTIPASNAWRIVQLPSDARPPPLPPDVAVGVNGRIGLGMFGVKSERVLPPATAKELTTPKSRRAGIGFSLKF